MSGNEILTLQFGKFANYVGSHYFNIQEAQFSFNPDFVPEIDNDILFREAPATNGSKAYTPRLIAVDSLHSIGQNASLTGETYQQLPKPEDLQNIFHNVEIPQTNPTEIKTQANPLISYEELDVKYWTDITSVPINHRSYHIINSVLLPKDVLNGLYTSGQSIYSQDFQEDLEDDIRYHLEDCDNLQGFQILVDSQTLFSGLSTECITHLRDEYNKKAILTCPLFYSDENIDYFNQRLNVLHCLSDSDIFIPLSTQSKPFQNSKIDFPFLNYQQTMYHMSSILGVALDMISLPYRERSREISLGHLVNYLCVHSRNFVSCGVNLPWKFKGNCLYDELLNWKGFTPLTPILGDESKLDLQFVSSKFNIASMIQDSDKKTIQEINPTVGFNTPKEVVEYYFYTRLGGMRTKASCFNVRCRLPRNFPDIFTDEEYKPKKGPDGLFYGKLRETDVIASLQQTKEMANLLKDINPDENFVKRVIPKLNRVGINLCDFESEVEDLSNKISNYEPTEYL